MVGPPTGPPGPPRGTKGTPPASPKPRRISLSVRVPSPEQLSAGNRPLKRFLLRTVQYTAIVVGTLVLVDLVCIAAGLFPPTYDRGDAALGWVAFKPTGSMHDDRCTEFSTGEAFAYVRNEDGIRTESPRQEILNDRTNLRIAVSGDSQTDLCAPNGLTHPGVLERALDSARLSAVVLAYGAGRYSPLQDYLVYKTVLRKYEPAVFVLNLYTGNDFYDILRVDDRPHFVRADSGYVIAPPVWYLYDAPGLRRHSRVLFALRSLAKRTGFLGLTQRLRLLRAAAAEQGRGLATVLTYMNDLRKSAEPTVGYPSAFSAQILNQQLFFHHFPDSRAEAVRRVRALLELVRRENPALVLVLSPLPSYQLVQQQPVDQALLRTLTRLPITYDGGVKDERALYDTLRVLAEETGWLFVDNLRALQAYDGPERLYNDFDYHLLPVASELIGRAQAEVLLRHLQPAPAR